MTKTRTNELVTRARWVTKEVSYGRCWNDPAVIGAMMTIVLDLVAEAGPEPKELDLTTKGSGS